MFRFARREFKNELTDEITRKPNIDMVTVLCHKELSAAVRNEATVLLNYLSSPDPENKPHTRMHTLVEWALTKTHNTKEIDDKYKIYQINRNAASILSSPSKKIMNLLLEDTSRYVFRVVRNFINTEEADDCIFAGHFQRIFECLTRSNHEWLVDSFIDDGFAIIEFIEKIAAKADIMAYQNILSNVALDLHNVLIVADFTLRDYIIMLLKEAAKFVFVIEAAKYDPYCSIFSGHNQSFSTLGRNTIQKRPVREQPINWKGNPMAKPSYIIDYSAESYIERTELYNQRLAEHRKFVGFDESFLTMDKGKAKAKAYFILNAVYRMVVENYDTVDVIKDQTIVKLLVCCGVYSDHLSMIAPQAFKIYDVVVYGCEGVEGIGHVPWLNDIASEFAPVIEFTEDVTPQMVAAFTAFWNHRFENCAIDGDEYEPVEIEYQDIAENVSDVNRMLPKQHDKSYVHVRSKGKTPMELYTHFLLDEPPLSDALNCRIMKILETYKQEGDKLRYGEITEWYDYQKEVIKHDLIFFDIMRSKFIYNGKYCDMSSIVDEYAKSPFIYEAWTKDRRYHAVLNGHKRMLVSYIMDAHFGELKHGEYIPLLGGIGATFGLDFALMADCRRVCDLMNEFGPRTQFIEDCKHDEKNVYLDKYIDAEKPDSPQGFTYGS